MPSKSRHWFTHHDDLTLLHITSDDPRRDGTVDLAFFERNLYCVVAPHEWKIKHGRIENELGRSLLSVLAAVHKQGSMQIENNPDFTKRNFTKKTGNGNVANLLKFMSQPDWKDKLWHAKHTPKFMKRQRYKSRSDWVEVPITVEDGAKIMIKVNTWLLPLIPERLCFRPKRNRCTLFLCPNKEQMKRPRCFNDRRHGQAFAEYIMAKWGDGATSMSHARTDMYDFRIGDDGVFTSAVWQHNTYHDVDEGTLLQIDLPDGFPCDLWTKVDKHVWPKVDLIYQNAARTVYFLVDNAIAMELKEFSWKPCMDGADAKCSRILDESGRSIKGYSLKRLVAALGGLQVNNINIAPRLSTYYNKAIEGNNLSSRARFENTIVSDVSTNNRMFTKAKFITHRRVHADKYVVIQSKNVIALDLRLESLRIGGASKTTNQQEDK